MQCYSSVDFPVPGYTYNVDSHVDFPVPGYTCNFDSNVNFLVPGYTCNIDDIVLTVHLQCCYSNVDFSVAGHTYTYSTKLIAVLTFLYRVHLQ